MDEAVSTKPSLFGRFTASTSQFGNKHGFYLGRRLTKVHVAIYRRSHGRLAGHLPGWPGARIVLVDHTGARTGKERTSPLMFHEDGDSVIVAATKGGQATNPAWFHNLMANPETKIQIGAETREVRALARFRRLLPRLRILQDQRRRAGNPDRHPRAPLIRD
jgi:deazaflavin-dependent oxidoreductase (nitroreductase family)